MIIIQAFKELFMFGVGIAEELFELIVINFIGLWDWFEEWVVFIKFGEWVIGKEIEEFWFLIFLVLDRF